MTRRAGSNAESESPARWRRWLPFLLLGLVVAATAGAIWWWLLRSQHYVTAVGGLERAVLSDYSLLELNSDSAVHVRYGWSLRSAQLLRGEAAIRVSDDSKRPFVLVAGSEAVRTQAGRFAVRRLPHGIEVVVIRGTVAIGPAFNLARPGSSISPATLKIDSGYFASYGPGGLQLRQLTEEELAQRLAWRGGHPQRVSPPPR